MSEDFFLTGGNGFVGAAVLALARASAVPMRAPARQEADILSPDSIGPAISGASIVIHAAGAAHLFRPTPESEAALWRTNVEGTRNVIRAARRAGARHVLLVSSVSVYSAEGVYAESKRKAEEVAREEAGGDLPLTVLRLATVYGEGDRGNVLRLIRLIDAGRFVWIGGGDNRKSLIDCRDVASAILLAARSIPSGFQVFDVSAPAVLMRDVVESISSALDRTSPRLRINTHIAHGAARVLRAVSLQNHRVVALERTLTKWTHDDVYDGSAFEMQFGFSPAVALKEGIAREVAWYRASRAGAPISGRSQQP